MCRERERNIVDNDKMRRKRNKHHQFGKLLARQKKTDSCQIEKKCSDKWTYWMHYGASCH